MLTIFTIPKPFRDHIGVIQRNGIRSWAALQPACEIMLFGNEDGIGRAAEEFGTKHYPDIALNDFGTPLLDFVFEKVGDSATHDVLFYVNTDIILLQDIIESVRRIPFRPFVMVGRRTNVDISVPWDFADPKWASFLRAHIARMGELYLPTWMDYLVFSRDMALTCLLPFAVGRPYWDNWFIYNARRSGISVIDATTVVTAAHQNHDYRHVPQRSVQGFYGPEADQNRSLAVQSMGTLNHVCGVTDATHLLTPQGLSRPWSYRHLVHRVSSWELFHPHLGGLVRLMRRANRGRKTIVGRVRGRKSVVS